jgi:hypothetical protein
VCGLGPSDAFQQGASGALAPVCHMMQSIPSPEHECKAHNLKINHSGEHKYKQKCTLERSMEALAIYGTALD